MRCARAVSRGTPLFQPAGGEGRDTAATQLTGPDNMTVGTVPAVEARTFWARRTIGGFIRVRARRRSALGGMETHGQAHALEGRGQPVGGTLSKTATGGLGRRRRLLNL